MAESNGAIVEVSAVNLYRNKWAVRPKHDGRPQLGTCGWVPRPWTVKIVHASSEYEAEQKGLRMFTQ